MSDTNDMKNDTYLTFYVNEELFGLNIHMVHEVLEYTAITRVPLTADFMSGIINVRGRVVPVVDLRRRFCLGVAEKTVHTAIIIVELEIDGESSIMGALVDGVQAVLNIMPDQIEAAPRLGNTIDGHFIQGIGKLGEQFVILLDIQAIFSMDELHMLAETQQQEETVA